MDVKLKGLPNEDLVQGYPGIPATWPRLAGTVEIRTLVQGKEALALDIDHVTVSLFRTDSVSVPSHRPALTANKMERSFLVTRQKEIYKSKLGGTKPYAIDIPFTLSLPQKPLTASISLSKLLESTYQVLVTVVHANLTTLSLQPSNYLFPVRIRRFDTLATFGVYSQHITGSKVGTDHLVSLEWVLPVSAYGPGDLLECSIQAPPNADWPKSKKVKLKRISVGLVQITRFKGIDNEQPTEQEDAKIEGAESEPKQSQARSSDSRNLDSKTSDTDPLTGDPTLTVESRTRISKVAVNFTGADQTNRKGLDSPEQLKLRIPNAYSQHDSDNVLPKELVSVGYEGRVPFTNSSSLFSITFELEIHARFSNAKDIVAHQPVTISQFDNSTCLHYMSSLVNCAQRIKRMDKRTHPPAISEEPLDTAVRIA